MAFQNFRVDMDPNTIPPWMLTAISNFNYGMRSQALQLAYENFTGQTLRQFYEFVTLYLPTMSVTDREWIDAIGQKILKENTTRTLAMHPLGS